MQPDKPNRNLARRTFLAGLGAAAGSVLLEPACQQDTPHSLLDVDYETLVSAADLIYRSPAGQPVEGHPVGNGHMGTLVWTEPSRLRMQINHNDVFAVNRNHKGARDGPADYCGGCAQVSIDVGSPVFEGGPQFEQRLSLYRAENTIAGNQVTARCFVSADTDVLALEIDDRRAAPQPIRVTLSMWRDPEVRNGEHVARHEFHDAPDSIVVTQTFEEGDHYCAAAAAIRVSGKQVAIEPAEDRSRTLALPAAAGKTTILISSAASWSPDSDPAVAARDFLEAAARQSYASLMEPHAAWWAEFWARTFVHIESADPVGRFMAHVRTLHLYFMAATSRGTLPAKWNASLFAVDGDKRNWGSQFWVWTTEVSHFPLYAADAVDLTDPFFNMYVKQLPACESAARQRWKANGAYFLEAGPFDGPVELPDDVAQEYFDVYQGLKPNTEFSRRARSFGQFECVLTQMADGRKPPHIAKGRYSWVSHIASSGSEVAVQAWWRYRYSGDKEWLRSHAYPLLKGTVEFYRSLAKKEDDGRYHLHGLNQHEAFWGVNDGNIDLSAIRGTAPLAIRAAEILGLDSYLRAKWRDLLENLAPYPMGHEPESKALAGGTLADDVWSIGHLGQVPGTHSDPGEALLFPVFPFEVWTLETQDAETDRIVAKIASLNPSRQDVLEGKPFGSAARTPVYGSRTGRGDDLPLILASYYAKCFSPLPNGLALFEGKTAHSIEHLGCITTALQEGLLQSVSPHPGEPEVIRVFAAWPKSWNAQFRLLARGGFLVTASMRDGRVEFVEVESRFGEECRVRNPWGAPCQVTQRGDLVAQVDNDIIRFPTTKGERYRILPAETEAPAPQRIAAAAATEPYSCSATLPNGDVAEATLGRRAS